MKERNTRYPYEFRSSAKKSIRQRSKNRCVITGSRVGLNMHHLLPVGFARENNIEKRIVRHRSNGVLVDIQHHKEIHREINSWDEEKKLAYFLVVYDCILSVMRGEVSKTLQEIKMPLYEIESGESVIYSATGD